MAKMVMHRALFTWFVLLVFLVLLCLRLEARTHWNWFLIFLPMWIYDLILLIDALFNIIASCLHDRFRNIFKNKSMLLFAAVVLLIAGQIMLCLKLEYRSLELKVTHVLIPFWILLPLLIVDTSITLFKKTY